MPYGIYDDIMNIWIKTNEELTQEVESLQQKIHDLEHDKSRLGIQYETQPEQGEAHCYRVLHYITSMASHASMMGKSAECAMLASIICGADVLLFIRPASSRHDQRDDYPHHESRYNASDDDHGGMTGF